MIWALQLLYVMISCDRCLYERVFAKIWLCMCEVSMFVLLGDRSKNPTQKTAYSDRILFIDNFGFTYKILFIDKKKSASCIIILLECCFV